MNVKQIIHTILLSMILLYAAGKLCGGLQLTPNWEYVVVFWFGWGVVNLIVPQLTTFITLPKQFVWLWLMNSILGAGYLLLANRVLPGVQLQAVVLPANTFLFVAVSRFVFEPTAMAIILGTLSALGYTLFKSLQSSK